DASSGRQPLHVAASEARRRAQRIGVIDHARAHDRDGLEAAMRMRREAGYDLAVIHAPAVLAAEVVAELAPVERRRRGEARGAGGDLIVAARSASAIACTLGKRRSRSGSSARSTRLASDGDTPGAAVASGGARFISTCAMTSLGLLASNGRRPASASNSTTP